jgi:cytochrome c-type biogenesis protein CcmE
VITGSLYYPHQTSVEFGLSEKTAELEVRFVGAALPDLFRVGQGVAAEGHMERRSAESRFLNKN